MTDALESIERAFRTYMEWDAETLARQGKPPLEEACIAQFLLSAYPPLEGGNEAAWRGFLKGDGKKWTAASAAIEAALGKAPQSEPRMEENAKKAASPATAGRDAQELANELYERFGALTKEYALEIAAAERLPTTPIPTEAVKRAVERAAAQVLSEYPFTAETMAGWDAFLERKKSFGWAFEKAVGAELHAQENLQAVRETDDFVAANHSGRKQEGA